MMVSKYTMNQCENCGRFTLLRNGLCGACNFELDQSGSFGLYIRQIELRHLYDIVCDGCAKTGATHRRHGEDYCDECWSKM